MHGWDPHKPQKMQCLLPLLIISHYHQDNSCCWWLNPIVIPLHRCSLSMAHLVSLHGLWDPLSATWARSARFQSLSSFSPGAMRYHSPPCQQLDHPWNMENPFFQMIFQLRSSTAPAPRRSFEDWISWNFNDFHAPRSKNGTGRWRMPPRAQGGSLMRCERWFITCFIPSGYD